ncbi:Alpha/beta hydrolase fold-1 [Lentinula aff. detonsa]|uniref:Alpha/beta hydrolase fold-1 n=1 Tax=Lentinula aff. detonsa TaxID=2804958 RepID=A0AA38KU99_9AGAR|nr:Alpha/beta hydrolase fold-1 [Lentinula aff. detonsa]
MLEEAVTYPPHDGYPLFLTAKRYWIPEFDIYAEDPEAWTLILLHSTASHKESWEPTLERLFHCAGRDKSVKIREAWCLDCPNHGASGHLNERALQTPEYYLNFTCDKYAEAIYHFLAASPDHGAKVDFRKRRLYGIGHSLGGNTMSLLQTMEPRIHFDSITIVDPMLSPAGSHHLNKLRAILIKGAYERRDVWPDRVTAMKALKRRDRTKKWDPRILDVFIKHGIRPHPGSYYLENPYLGVTLACTRDQEAAMYRDPEGATKPVKSLDIACREKPIHLVLGGIHDFMPQRTHEALLDKKSGRVFASTTIIKESGHLVPLEVPDILGEVLYANIRKSGDMLKPKEKSKL